MCYKKCSLLTNGTYIRRIAPNGCCKELSLRCVEDSEVDFSGLFPGSGYNVNIDGASPHSPGVCDGNEEFHAGMCYKKCSLLTNNQYPIRSGADTCCSHSCWNVLNTLTQGGMCQGFGVGGGMVPAHACPHGPN